MFEPVSDPTHSLITTDELTRSSVPRAHRDAPSFLTWNSV